MSFTDTQVRKLRASIRRQHVREREIDGKLLHYVEGWYVIAEANRIFGFDGWDRETVASTCVWQKQVDSRYAAAYLTRVKITVKAGDRLIVREGLGSSEATAPSPGQAHERASKAAETDATKRALSTFGNPFGLSLYRDKAEPPKSRSGRPPAPKQPTPEPPPPPRLDELVERLLPVRVPIGSRPALLQNSTGLHRIEKSALAISEPKRLRSRDHLRFVATQACLVCGRTPSQAHHLRCTQPRAMGRKVSDEFTVPLCALHHHELHMRGNESAWWAERNVDPLPAAADLWAASCGAVEPKG